MTFRFCDERDASGFSWIADLRMTRTSHALTAGGRVWLVDPLDWHDAIDRAGSLGRITAVVQLLDRHNRDCAELAARLRVPHLRMPEKLPESPFTTIPLRRSRLWLEMALWWPEKKTLVVADAIGTTRFFTAGRDAAGVHLLLRLTPPRRQLRSFEPEHLLVGHGEGLHGPLAAEGLRRALAGSRRGLPRIVLDVPRQALRSVPWPDESGRRRQARVLHRRVERLPQRRCTE